MRIAPTQSLKANLFQAFTIALGGGVWLSNLWQMRVLDRTSVGAISLMGLVTIVISLNPVTFTTPGMKLENQNQISISLSDALTFLTLVLYGPPAAIVLSGVDGLIASRRTIRRWQSNFFTGGMLSLSILVASSAYEGMMWSTGLPSYNGLHQPPLALVLPLLIASIAHFIVNSFLCAEVIALRYQRSFWRQLIDNHVWTGITYLPLAALAVVLYACVQHFGWFSVLATIPVLGVIYFSYQQYNQKVEEKLRKIDEINCLNLATVQSLALAIDARSGSSAGHAERVKVYVRGLARAFNLSELETQALEAGAMLRDVGMLAVPDHILTKPGHLSPAELERVKQHTIVGAEILGQIDFPYPVVPIVRHHHERWDGNGYPDGLAGAEIPLTARILSVADCFDASREKRNHRHALDLDRSVGWLRENSGKQFDPGVVEAFVALLPELEAEIIRWMHAQASPGTHSSRKQIPGSILKSRESAAAYSRSLEQISGAHREVVTLYELAQSVGRSLSLNETLELLLDRTRELVPSNTSAVLLKDKDGDTLRIAHVIGDHHAAMRDGEVASSAGNIGAAFINQTIYANADPRPDLQAIGLPAETGYLTSMIVPLTSGGAALGVLVLFSSEFAEFSIEDVRLMESVARLAVDAVSNALNHEEARETAYTDRLTGLPNMRSILEAFESEAERSRTSGRSFSFLMMDLDGFKGVNDTFGHQMGDLFLIEISNRIRSQMRSGDLFGRYAGDEFIAILRDTTVDESGEIVQRIRQAVDECVIETSDGRGVRGGISIGVTECNGYSAGLEEVMSVADAAMYADKAGRRQAAGNPLAQAARKGS